MSGNANSKLPSKITRQQILDACEVLGLDPTETREVTITSSEVEVERFLMWEDDREAMNYRARRIKPGTNEFPKETITIRVEDDQ